MIYQTIVFSFNADQDRQVYCSYHNYTLDEAVEQIKRHYPGENCDIVVYNEVGFVFRRHLIDGELVA